MTWCVTNGRNHTLVPSLAILASTLLWGTLWIPLRALDHAGLGGAWATTTGFTIPLLCLLPGAFLRRQRIVAGGRSLLGTGLLAALGISLYAQGLLRGEVARVILLFYLMPVWSTLLAWWILGHSITRGRILTIALGLTGMVAVFGGDHDLPLPRTPADWMGLLSGFCWGWSLVRLRRTEDTASFDEVFVQFVMLGPSFFLLTLVSGTGSPSLRDAVISTRTIEWLSLFGLIWMPSAIWLTLYGSSRIDPARAAILLMFEVVVGLVSAAILANEPISASELLGAALILAAGVSEFFFGGESSSASLARVSSGDEGEVDDY
jgi:drug/metabolite transporter (DMT)-like permease